MFYLACFQVVKAAWVRPRGPRVLASGASSVPLPIDQPSASIMGHPVSQMSPVMFSVPYIRQSPVSPSGTMAVMKDSLLIPLHWPHPWSVWETCSVPWVGES